MTTHGSNKIDQTPYWLAGIERVTGTSGPLPDQADVVIIGSGYTGLNAAIEVARGGLSVLVVEAGIPGFGCSTRNGGQIAPGLKPSLEALTRKYGAGTAQAMIAEGDAAMDWIENRVIDDAIDCDYSRCGLFYAAHTPTHYDGLARWVDAQRKTQGMEAYVVERSEQRQELGTDIYFGGAVLTRNAGLHPAKYLHGLLKVAMKAGVQVVGQCAATKITRNGAEFSVQTQQGNVRSGNVIVATNGYTGSLTPWLQRRVVPITSNVIATEELPEDLVRSLFPTGRMACDTRKVVYYYRASPDGRRVVFGGRVAAREIGPEETARRLSEKMHQIFPELRGSGISHGWLGHVAFTFDELPHTGCHDGVHYAMGYCGSGVAMSSYLGGRIGQQVLGLPEGATAFDKIDHPTRPFYSGKTWFLPAAIAWYKWQDSRAQKKAGV